MKRFVVVQSGDDYIACIGIYKGIDEAVGAAVLEASELYGGEATLSAPVELNGETGFLFNVFDLDGKQFETWYVLEANVPEENV